MNDNIKNKNIPLSGDGKTFIFQTDEIGFKEFLHLKDNRPKFNLTTKLFQIKGDLEQ